jgi:hypothetical protein
MVRWLLQTWAVVVAHSGDLPAPKLSPITLLWGPLSVLLCSNCGKKQQIACSQWKIDSRVLWLVAQNPSKFRAIYRGFRYGLLEESETYPIYLEAGFKSQRSKQNWKRGNSVRGWTWTWVRLGRDRRVGSVLGGGEPGMATGPLGQHHGPQLDCVRKRKRKTGQAGA